MGMVNLLNFPPMDVKNKNNFENIYVNEEMTVHRRLPKETISCGVHP